MFDWVLNTPLNFVLQLAGLGEWNKLRGKSKMKLRDNKRTHNFPKTSFEGPLREVLRTSSKRRPWKVGLDPRLQIRTSSGWSNRIFKGRSVVAGGKRPRDVLGTNIYRLG